MNEADTVEFETLVAVTVKVPGPFGVYTAFTPLVVVAGLNVPALAAGVPETGAALHLTPLGSVVVAAIEYVFAVAIAARAIGTLTLTPPADDDDVEELLDEVELDVEEDEEEDEVVEDEDDDAPSDPPPPQAGRRAAQASASMPPSSNEAVRRSSRCGKLGGRVSCRAAGSAGASFEVESGRLDGPFSCIRQSPSGYGVRVRPAVRAGRSLRLLSKAHTRAVACVRRVPLLVP